jgi:hypothetical protein
MESTAVDPSYRNSGVFGHNWPAPIRTDGGLYLPWGPRLNPDDVRRLRAELIEIIETLTEDAVPAGHGFELYPVDVLKVCRAELEPIDEGDQVMVRLDLLHLLAYPFSQHHRKPD